MLATAIKIATQAHEYQKDLNGEPYILHPLRVMQNMETQEEKIVAILHDVVEDSSVILYELKKIGFSSTVINAIDVISRKKDETVNLYYHRIFNNKIAIKVKIKDLEDNMNLTRYTKIKKTELNRIEMYHKYWRQLKSLL